MVKDSDILKAARKNIAEGESILICSAIDDCAFAPYSQRESLRMWIESMLGNCETYGTWLRENRPKTWEEERIKPDGFRPGRLAWLDWMIAECEKAEAANG